MAKVNFKRVKTNSEVDNIDIEDGNFIVTGEGRTFVDYENKRIPVCSVLPSIYPVGSIYLSVLDVNPKTLFGFGTWEQIKDMFLLGAGDKYSAGSTGGEATHTLTINEMPSHKHDTHEIGYGNPTWSGSISNFQLAHSLSAHEYAENGTREGNYYTFRGGGTNEVGGGQAHNNMPPYLAVYMWKRVA